MGGDRWAEESRRPDWPRRVADAIAAMPAPRGVRIESVGVAPDAHVVVTYRRDDTAGVLGLRVDPRARPPVGGDADDLTEDLAGWVVAIEIGEPRGRRQDTTWTDPSGTTWRACPWAPRGLGRPARQRPPRHR